jgi:hypothetical protein
MSKPMNIISKANTNLQSNGSNPKPSDAQANFLKKSLAPQGLMRYFFAPVT